jgi:two-component system, chemotaxis family, chemotaxis protein CheY
MLFPRLSAQSPLEVAQIAGVALPFPATNPDGIAQAQPPTRHAPKPWTGRSAVLLWHLWRLAELGCGWLSPVSIRGFGIPSGDVLRYAWLGTRGVGGMGTRTHGRRRLQAFCLAPSGATGFDRDHSTQPSDAAGADAGPEPSSSSRRDPTTITILVVEDNESLRQSTADILQAHGYSVIEAVDGIEGLQILQGTNVDILLLDLALPRLDGIGVLEALDDVPVVIIVSAFEYYDKATMRDRFGSKVFAFLQKPVRPQRLLEVVAKALSHREPG